MQRQTWLCLKLWQATSKSIHVLHLELSEECFNIWLTQMRLSGVELAEIIIENLVESLSVVKHDPMLRERIEISVN